MEQFKREGYINQTEAVKAHKMTIKDFKALVEGLPFIDRPNRSMGTYSVDIKYYLKADFLRKKNAISKF